MTPLRQEDLVPGAWHRQFDVAQDAPHLEFLSLGSAEPLFQASKFVTQGEIRLLHPIDAGNWCAGGEAEIAFTIVAQPHRIVRWVSIVGIDHAGHAFALEKLRPPEERRSAQGVQGSCAVLVPHDADRVAALAVAIQLSTQDGTVELLDLRLTPFINGNAGKASPALHAQNTPTQWRQYSMADDASSYAGEPQAEIEGLEPAADWNFLAASGLEPAADGVPRGIKLEQAEASRLSFERVAGPDSLHLRIWLVHPLPERADATLAMGQTVLLRFLPLVPEEAAGFRLTASIDVRATLGDVPLILRVLAGGAGTTLLDLRQTMLAGSDWSVLRLDFNIPPATAIVRQWCIELRSTTETVMAAVEFRNPQFGAFRETTARIAPAAVRPQTFHQPPRGGFSSSNLLNTLDVLKPDGHGGFALAEKWTTIRGRNGELDIAFGLAPWCPDEDPRLLPRSVARLAVSLNPFYFRLSHQLRGTDIARFRLLEAELVIGAEGVDGIATGLAMQAFLRVLKADNTEAVLPILAKRSIPPNIHAIKSTLSLDDAQAVILREGKSAQFIIEITGTGNLLLGPVWFGDAALPAAKPQRISAAADQALREWHYQRYLETAEMVFLPSLHRAPLVAFVHAPDGPLQDAQIARILKTVISLVSHAARTIILLRDTAPDASIALRRALSKALSVRQIAHIAIETAASAGGLAASLTARCATVAGRSYVVILEAGTTVRADFSQALGTIPQGKEAAAFVVFDHDICGEDGARRAPTLKPGISPHLLLETDYIGPAIAFRADALKGVLKRGAISPVLPFGIRDIALLLMHAGHGGAKLDHVLMHLAEDRVCPSPEEEMRFVQSVIERERLPAAVSRWGSELTVAYSPDAQPLVSIIIPFKDKLHFLSPCIESIFKRTQYAAYEIVLVDNQSVEPETLAYLEGLAENPKIRIVAFRQPFNYSAANNLGARSAAGTFLVFLNNDTEVLSTDWLDRLMGLAALPRTGFVGARLHFGNGTIQHAGIVVGLHGLANHALAGEHDVTMPGMLTLHTRDVSAVTGAAMCIKADRYHAIGGYDERFLLTGNDVEICLRARRNGLQNVYAGGVQLLHFEKSSRKDIPVYLRDIQLSLETYEPELSKGDPFWNHALSRVRTDYLPRAAHEPTSGDERQAAAEKRLREMRARKLGNDTLFIAQNDIDRAQIEANRASNRAYANGEAGPVRRAAWFVPPVSHIYRGGLYTCFRFAASLFRRNRVEPLIVLCSEKKPDYDLLRQQFLEAFPDVPFAFHHFNPARDAPSTIPLADIAIATLWTTAFIAARYGAKGKFYLIQDYEPLFEAAGAGYGLIEATYRLGFFPICNSPGVAAAIAPYADVPSFAFSPAVDRTIFHPRTIPAPAASPTRIVFYGRPNNPRNLFGLGMHALIELKAALRDEVEIVSAGATFDPKEHGAAGKIHNLGLLPSIESVAALYRSSDIGLVFMQSKHPSYQPLEYMASGCATVTNFNEANAWLLRDRENCALTQVTLTNVVETLTELVRDRSLRNTLQAAGLATISQTDWPEIETKIADFLLAPGKACQNSRRKGTR